MRIHIGDPWFEQWARTNMPNTMSEDVIVAQSVNRSMPRRGGAIAPAPTTMCASLRETQEQAAARNRVRRAYLASLRAQGLL